MLGPATDAVVTIEPVCPGPTALLATVRNIGQASLPSGIPVGFYEGTAPGWTLLGHVSTTKVLSPRRPCRLGASRRAEARADPGRERPFQAPAGASLGLTRRAGVGVPTIGRNCCLARVDDPVCHPFAMGLLTPMSRSILIDEGRDDGRKATQWGERPTKGKSA